MDPASAPSAPQTPQQQQAPAPAVPPSKLGRDPEPPPQLDPEPAPEAPDPEDAAPAGPSADDIKKLQEDAANWQYVVKDPALYAKLLEHVEGMKQPKGGGRNGKVDELAELREIVQTIAANQQAMAFAWQNPDLRDESIKKEVESLVAQNVPLKVAYDIAKRMQKATAANTRKAPPRVRTSEEVSVGSRSNPAIDGQQRRFDAIRRGSDAVEDAWKLARSRLQQADDAD